MTVRAAIVQLRTEGLVTSRAGFAVLVAEPGPPRRLSDDILIGEGLYRAVERLGLEADIATTIDREPASADVAEALGVELGAEVLVHTRLVRVEGKPPMFLATNHFPSFVAAAVPQLARPSRVGLPKLLADTYGDLHGEDLIDSRMPTPEEREQLEIPPNTPVSVIRGLNRDSQRRPLHYIVKVTPSGRFPPMYRFGKWPED
jgi:GntR family transcriptional regulator